MYGWVPVLFASETATTSPISYTRLQIKRFIKRYQRIQEVKEVIGHGVKLVPGRRNLGLAPPSALEKSWARVCRHTLVLSAPISPYSLTFKDSGMPSSKDSYKIWKLLGFTGTNILRRHPSPFPEEDTLRKETHQQEHLEIWDRYPGRARSPQGQPRIAPGTVSHPRLCPSTNWQNPETGTVC